MEASVKVFVRFRPLNSREKRENDGGATVELKGSTCRIVIKGKDNEFSFDEIFHPDSTQESIYESVRDAVQVFGEIIFCFLLGASVSDDCAGVTRAFSSKFLCPLSLIFVSHLIISFLSFQRTLWRDSIALFLRTVKREVVSRTPCLEAARGRRV